MKNAVFYHDGCEICSEVGKELVGLVGLSKLDIIHVGLNPAFLEKAEKAGVKAYPALITANGNVLHFNTEQHGGDIACLF